MDHAPTPFMAAHRFGFGLAGTKAPGTTGRDALHDQLAHPEWALITEPLPDGVASIRDFVRINNAFNAFRNEVARRETEGIVTPAGTPAPVSPGSPYVLLVLPELRARTARAMSGEADFLERLVVFWSNHFAVSMTKGGTLMPQIGPYERSVIRPGITGKFVDLLLAATRHPAMLLFLDNNVSVGPNSPVGLRRRRGLNENLAREILELHTLGVDGGYTQADVTAFAAALTGWTVTGYNPPPDAATPPPDPGQFIFRAQEHEPGPQTVLGRVYAEPGEDQARAILRDLARHPATARFIAGKMARHFIADVPPPGLVARMAATYLATDGDLGALARSMIDAPEAWAPPLAKLRSPYEFLIAAQRTVGVPVFRPRAYGMLANLGQQILAPASPAGFPDTSDDWMGADAIKTRADFALEFATGFNGDPAALARGVLGPALTDETLTAIRRAETGRQGLVLLLMSPEFQRR